jgi:hypothetical protein
MVKQDEVTVHVPTTSPPQLLASLQLTVLVVPPVEMVPPVALDPAKEDTPPELTLLFDPAEADTPPELDMAPAPPR